MPIPSVCPGCGETGMVPDNLKGKKVRCKNCQRIFIVGGSSALSSPARPAGTSAIQDRPRPAPRRRPAEDKDEWDGIERPKRSSGSPAVLALLLGGGLLAAVGCFGVSYLLFTTVFPSRDTAESRPPDEIDDAIGALKSLDAGRRQKAAAFLAITTPDERRQAEVARALEPLLNDNHPQSREAAARALAIWATRDNVPALLQALDHPAPEVRRYAMQALGKVQDERAVAPLAQRLADHTQRTEASAALQKIGPIAEKEVVKLMNHPDHFTREEARRLVRLYGTKENVWLPQVLTDLEAAEADRRRHAAEWLAQARPDPLNQLKVARALEKALQDSNDQVRVAVARALGVWATRDSLERLIAALNDRSHQVRGEIMLALAKLQDPRAAAALAQRLVAEPSDRFNAANALQQMGPVAEPEVKKLLTHADFGVRHEAGRILKGLGRGDVEIDQHLADLKSNEVFRRRQAVEWFAKAVPDEQRRADVGKALEPLLRDADPDVRLKAMQVMGLWGTKENVPAVIAVLKDAARFPNLASLRVAAVETLAQIKDEQAIRTVASLLAETTSPADLQLVITALKVIGPAAEPEVIKYLQTKYPTRTRVAACQALALIGTKESLGPLETAAGDSDRQVSASARLATNAIKSREK
ncbi:MAG TPA: HEAT repeat domain-containing protein [Gemmataceae bacterium]|nr:HEAT repeat domain-containing protein [Gemmataceae bacterium]